MSMLYFDSCIGIYYVERRNPWYDALVLAVSGLENDIAVSDLVRLECRVLPVRQADGALLVRFEQFFALTTIVPLTTAVFDRATELRAKYNFKTPDALHLAAAIEHGCSEFWTNDHRLDSARDLITIRPFDPAR